MHRWTLMITGALLLGLSLGNLQQHHTPYLLRDGHLFPYDFVAFYSISTLLNQSSHQNIYRLEDQRTAYEAVLTAENSGYDGYYFLPFLNPPPSLLLFYPLSWFDLDSAYHGWRILSALIALLSMMIVALGRLTSMTLPDRLIVCGIICGSPFLSFTLQHGQTTALVGMGMVLFYMGWHYLRFGPLLCGLLLLSIKPHFALLPLTGLIGLSKKYWIGLLVALTLFLAATTSGWDMQIWPDYISLVRTMLETHMGYGSSPAHMANLRGFAYHLLPDGLFAYILFINTATLLLAASVLYVVWRHVRSRPAQAKELWFGLAVCIGVWLSPWQHHHDLWLLCLPAILYYFHTENPLHKSAYALITWLFYLICFSGMTDIWGPMLYQWALIGYGAFLLASLSRS